MKLTETMNHFYILQSPFTTKLLDTKLNIPPFVFKMYVQI